MSVNWKWEDKIGEVFIEQEKEKGVKHSFKLDMYTGNCLAIVLYNYKVKDNDNGNMVEKYSLYCWFSDMKHLKNCLGLSNQYKDNVLTEIKKVRLNTYYLNDRVPELLKMAYLFTKANIKVELFYKEPKKDKSHSKRKDK